MLRLCKKCGSRLKFKKQEGDFTIWECSNDSCKEVFTFEVEKKKETPIIEEEKEKIVINVPKFNKTFKEEPEEKEDTRTEAEKIVESILKSQNSKYKSQSKDTSFSFSVHKSEEENTIPSEEIPDKNKVSMVIETSSPEESKEDVNINEESKKDFTLNEEKKDSALNKEAEKLEKKTGSEDVNEVSEDKILSDKKTEDKVINTEYDDDLEETFTDEENKQIDSETVEVKEEKPDEDYDPYSIDLEAEDARFPLTWKEETQYVLVEDPKKEYQPTKFVCPYCSGTKFAVTAKITRCVDCDSKFLNQKINTELYYALTEATKLRQRANFIDAKNIIQEVIDRYPGEELSDAYFALGIAQSNIIFRENVRTGKKFATVYEPYEIPFSENPNIKRALNVAKLQSDIKYNKLKELADEINSSAENFNSILTQNGRYTVFICYHQGERAHIFTKDLLHNLSKITRTFVVGKVNEIVDDNKDLMSKIYYGLNSSKIMVLLCTSKEDVESPSVVWRYKSFLSVNRQKYIIPVLMNGFKREDLPEELQRFESIEWGGSTLLDIQKMIHRLLPEEYLNQDYLEEKLDKIERCLLDKKYIEAKLRTDRLATFFKKNPYVYFYRLLAKFEINEEDNIARITEDLKDLDDFKLAKKYADDALLGRLISYEMLNNKLQKLRRKQAKREKRKKEVIAFLTKPIMQYIYTAIFPVILGLLVLFTQQSFVNVKSIYLFIIAGVIMISTLVLILVSKFNPMTIATMFASVLFLFGTTCISRIDFINNNGVLYSYTLNNEERTIRLTKENSLLTNSKEDIVVNIPEVVKVYGKNYRVTTISESLFENCYDIDKIYIPKYITSIEPYAFKNISATIEFAPDSELTVIGDYAFAEYKGEHIINLPRGLKTIGEGAFMNCQFLTDNGGERVFTIPRNVVNIGANAFANTRCTIAFEKNSNLTVLGENSFGEYKGQSITLPESLRRIETHAFYKASNITEFYVPEDITSIGVAAFEGMDRLVKLHTPLYADSNVSYRNQSVIASYFGGRIAFNEHTKMTLDILGKNMIIIPENAFRNCESLVTINVYSDKITKVCESAFRDAINLEEVNFYTLNGKTLNTSITEIERNAFEGCEKLGYCIRTDSQNKKVIGTTFFLIPQNLEVLGIEAFKNCTALEEITITDSLYDIGIDAFAGCTKLEEVYIIKYTSMDNVPNEKRFSYTLIQGAECGKLLANVNKLYVSETEEYGLVKVVGIKFEYVYTELSTQKTIDFNQTVASKTREQIDRYKDLLIFTVQWKIYIPATND